MIKQWSSPPPMVTEPGRTYRAVLETNLGEMCIELLPEEAPLTVNNFVFLAREGFYTNVPIHRIVPGFVIQTGDPTGTGMGGPGYRFPDEPVVSEYSLGTVAMANAGPNTNGSQFFIVLADLRGRLPKQYTIFGRLVSGLDVLQRIASVPVMRGPSGEVSSPREPVTLQRVTILEENETR
jgi:cyclophilin family peptidyl-prolyl cis-trans isomerase